MSLLKKKTNSKNGITLTKANVFIAGNTNIFRLAKDLEKNEKISKVDYVHAAYIGEEEEERYFLEGTKAYVPKDDVAEIKKEYPKCKVIGYDYDAKKDTLVLVKG